MGDSPGARTVIAPILREYRKRARGSKGGKAMSQDEIRSRGGMPFRNAG